MKRIFTLAVVLLLVLAGKAQTFSYLTFQQTDGTQRSLTANGLKITFSGGNLVATSAEGVTTLPLGVLSRMFFSSQATGVVDPTMDHRRVIVQDGQISVTAPAGSVVRVYTAQGRLFTNVLKRWNGTEEICSGMEHGLYLVSVAGVTTKVYIR